MSAGGLVCVLFFLETSMFEERGKGRFKIFDVMPLEMVFFRLADPATFLKGLHCVPCRNLEIRLELTLD